MVHGPVTRHQAKDILDRIPGEIPLEPVSRKYPVKYEESMNTVLQQEVCVFTDESRPLAPEGVSSLQKPQ